MTTISATSSYSSSYASVLASTQSQAKTTAAAASSYSSSQSGATNITLSEAAKAALTIKDFATVITEARATMDQLLSGAGLTTPLDENGKPAVDLSKVDRRELYAMSINAGQSFTADEQKAAQAELQSRFDQALAGPTAVGRVTGKVDGLYAAALDYFDAMGPEEKASTGYADARKAIVQMIARLKTDPGTLPGTFSNDPINDYMERLAAGETGELRPIADVGSDARTTLDAQYAAGSTSANFKDFDSRSLAAVALNTNSAFSETETRAARSEMRNRTGAAVLAALNSSDATTNPAGFSQNVISLYGAMSTEERAAAGWSENLYAAAVASYQSSSKLASMLGSTTGSTSMWGSTNSDSSSAWWNDTSSDSDSGDKMSLLSYL